MSRNSATGVLFAVLLLLLLLASLYVLYLSLPKESVPFQVIGNGESEIEKPVYETSKQFYENMRFRDKIISYKIDETCSQKKISEVKYVFSTLEDKTSLSFVSSPSPELEISCSDVQRSSANKGYFIAGEGGPTEVINTTLYGVILSAKVSFFREDKCEEPKVAMHEILHALGFDHNNNPGSILYPTLDCAQELDESIIKDLNTIYSVDSKPDLKITSVEASVSGRYLNFELEAINQGLVDAENVYLEVYSDNKLIKSFDLNDINIGIRKTLSVGNLSTGFFSRGIDELTFVLDPKNDLDEIFEDNNQISLRVS